MATRCQICGKKPRSGNYVSHSQRRTHRRFFPNLRSVRIDVDGKSRRMLLCTKCLKSRKVEVVEEK